ncbi:polyhydroxyalkanoate depolymerase [Cupriavidus sp. NPDC089707]|uniref:polyhydroxyalkanoate depolymerase n=1 Tax=Cupriavidus sp. NPDC089707 TaxID=3363963 RepID=UPI0037FF401A
MMYQTYQAVSDLLAPLRAVAGFAAATCHASPDAASSWRRAREICALYEWLTLVRLRHERPQFGIHSVPIGSETVAVDEVVERSTAFCSLVHFRKAVPMRQPRVLLIAPLAGHFATLLRPTVATMLPDHDVYLTDWHNARDVPVSHGPFGLDDFIALLIDFLGLLGPDVHVVAVCQPTVATLAAVALMAEDGHPAPPRSMTLIAGPNDTRVQPTRVDELAVSTPLTWFEQNLIDVVPLRFAGARRRVYPGFVQVAAFLSMHPERHASSLMDCYQLLAQGDTEKAAAIRAFYADYFATMDVPAEFYLDTVRKVFQQHALPRGKLMVRGRRVDLRAIRHTALLTIEGEDDDICAVGQTAAAHALCSNLPPYLKHHYVQTAVGHYGVFAGRHWATQVYPLVRDVIHSSERHRPSAPA